ncbi:hypothetical protein ADL03_25665 [Nocardia sp. NRRL S-836]|nr:hypothetical protein ADL03_25665 [Nocardia sp. NRRL S-836]
MLVHASFDVGYQVLGLLPADVSGLALRGAKSLTGIRELRRNQYKGVLVHDPEGYVEAAATADEPFVLPEDDGLFSVSLNDAVQAQLDAGATVAMTPTGYFLPGDADPMKVAGKMVADLDRDDVLFSVPIDVAWLTNDSFPQLVAVLSRIPVPKAILLGGQFDPMDKYRAAVANLRRLVAEGGDVAVFRTDLTAFDVMSHGAFATSIGTGGSLRHVVPLGQFPRASKKKDFSPSVLLPELMTFHKGSLLSERFSNARRPPTCACSACNGRGLDTFLAKSDTPAAHAHGVHIWNSWIADMLGQRVLFERAEWWQSKCASAIDHCDVINAEIEQAGAFKAPRPLKAWAELPAWSPMPAPATAP